MNKALLKLIEKVLSDSKSFGEARMAFQKAVRGKYTPEEIAEGKKVLQQRYSTAGLPLITLEDLYLMENPMVRKIGVDDLDGLHLIILELMLPLFRDMRYRGAELENVSGIVGLMRLAVSPSNFKFIGARGRVPLFEGTVERVPTGDNKLRAYNYMLDKLIDLTYLGLTPGNLYKVNKVNMDALTRLIKSTLPPKITIDHGDFTLEIGALTVAESMADNMYSLPLRRDVLRTSITGEVPFGTKFDPELLKALKNSFMGTVGAVGATSMFDDDPIVLHMNQSYKKGGRIHIKEKNKGKFTETKKRTGKTTEELTHSKNPITRKRAIFAQNAAKWNHSKS